MATLAIKGHATRGREVIELLEMLGGVTYHNLMGTEVTDAYYIRCDGRIRWQHYTSLNDCIILSLEEFLEKYPYKVGDKVIIKGLPDYPKEIKYMEWDSTHNYIVYSFGDDTWFPTNALQPYNEQKETPCNFINFNAKNLSFADKVELQIGDKWEVKTEENGRTYVVKKQPKYPTTYEECIGKLPISWDNKVEGYKNELLNSFQKLFICRDAYWKIAGEQMGLDKPWKPDWCNENKLKYCIECSFGTIDETRSIVNGCFLAFPTAEMRDAFYENFKELIEECKELL